MKTFTILALCILFLTLFTTPSNADSWPPPEPFSVVSADGERIFFFTPPRIEWQDPEPWEGALPTGMYTNTSSPQLIYELDFSHELLRNTNLLWEQDFVFSDCMSYFAVFPQPNGYQLSAIAFHVYANGALQHTTMVTDVISIPNNLTSTESMTPWVYRNTISFDSETNMVTFTTIENATFEFNIAYEGESFNVNCVTGCLSSGLSTRVIAIFIVAAIGLVIACYLIYKQINNKRKEC